MGLLEDRWNEWKWRFDPNKTTENDNKRKLGFYEQKQKELEGTYGQVNVGTGGQINLTYDKKKGDVIGATTGVGYPAGVKVPPGKNTQNQNLMKNDFNTKGGINQKNTDPRWWEKLGAMAGVDMNKAQATWKEKGGFEGLMANPAFTMGLAFMQAGAEGKTLGQGALDNVMKAAGISSHYKKIIEDRKQAPIQATSTDIAEVKGLLETMNIEDPSWLEKVVGKFKGVNRQAMFDMAAEDIANALQIEMQKLQEANKGKTPLVFNTRRKLKILKRLEREGKIKKKGGTLVTAATLETDVPIRTRATGGQVAQGQPYVVGEGGPEYFLPKESGKVLSNDDSRIFAMLLTANPQLQQVSRTRAEKILRNRFPEYFE